MKILFLLLILLMISTPAIADKNKGIFSGEILKDDLAAYTSNISEIPGYISDNQSPVQSELQNIQDWMYIGKTQLTLGNWKLAEETFAKIIDQEPKNTEGWEGYLLAIRGGGDYDKLLEASERATKENPDFATAWKYNGIALTSLDQSEEALRAFDVALKKEPDSYTIWYYIGLTLDSIERYNESISAYDQVLAEDPKFAKAWNNKAVALTNIGRYDEAINAFDTALALDPEFKKASENKAVALQKRNTHTIGSIIAIDDATVLTPPSPDSNPDIISADANNFNTIENVNATSKISIPGLVAHYSFSGNADDVSEKKLNGKNFNAQPDLDRFNQPNGSMYFNGKDAYIELPAVPELKPSAFSIVMWVKIKDFGPDWNQDSMNAFIYFSKNRNPEWFEGIHFSGLHHGAEEPAPGGIFGLYVPYMEQTYSYVGTSSNIVTDTWYFVGLTGDNQKISIYIDGILMGEKETGFDILYDPYYPEYIAGSNEYPENLFFNGYIDDMKFFNKVLSYDEIHSLYNQDVSFS